MIKGICFGNIAIDCKDAVSPRDFYADLLGGDPCIRYDCPALRSPLGLLLLFMEADSEYVKPVWPEEIGKKNVFISSTGKNQNGQELENVIQCNTRKEGLL